ncbi:MAG: DUF433 domain-containing protein [Candidatus Hodarchaeales archaeon]
MKEFPNIIREPEICGGRPVIRGTRVLVLDILALLRSGQSFDEILEGFPTISKDHIVEILEYAEALIAGEIVSYRPRTDALSTR